MNVWNLSNVLLMQSGCRPLETAACLHCWEPAGSLAEVLTLALYCLAMPLRVAEAQQSFLQLSCRSAVGQECLAGNALGQACGSQLINQPMNVTSQLVHLVQKGNVNMLH
jgi:hypothetical protein